MVQAIRWSVRLAMVGVVVLVAALGCTSDGQPPSTGASSVPGSTVADQSPAAADTRTIGAPDADGVALVLDGPLLDGPTSVSVRPGRAGELWVTNDGNDSLTILHVDGDQVTAESRTDAFAEHFVARPSGLAFTGDGSSFAVANNSNNEVRDMDFVINPERNVYFKGSNFMGPTLFMTDTFALAGQSKAYLDDWVQPGYGHDPRDDVPQDQCPTEYWSVEVARCEWPREGSHVDMLHGDPLAMGIAHDADNVFYLLDGCGSRQAGNVCAGDGHVSMVDFNRDHQEGNGFHGDGVQHRFVDAPFTRVDGVPAGIVVHDGTVVYADTGAGVVRVLHPDTGRTEVLVGPWYQGAASRHEHGPGIIDWAHVPGGPGDGDTPEAIDAWIASAGDPARIAAAGDRWIEPQETLGEYAYVYGSEVTEAVPSGSIARPSGIASSADSLFVVDHETGTIAEHRWSDLTLVRTIATGRPGLAGLTYSADENALYATSTTDDALFRISL